MTKWYSAKEAPNYATKNGFLQNGMMETMEVLSTKLIIFTLLFIGKIM